MDAATISTLAALGPVALWLMAVGFFSPPVIAVIQQAAWSARRKSIVAFVFYLVVAAVTAWLNGIFTTVGLVTAILVVFVVASTAYKNLWKPTGVAPAIQAVTSAADGKHEAGALTIQVVAPDSVDHEAVARVIAEQYRRAL